MPDTAAKPPLIRINVVVLIGLPLTALVLVPLWGYYQGFDGFLWWVALLFLYLNGLSITGGYHRLWAHKAYQAHGSLRLFYALWGAGALQNSILVWSSDHRRHHRYVDDNERDPYSAGRGLWYSHMGWMLREYRAQVNNFDNVPDLQRDPIVMWQHQHYLLLVCVMNIALPVAIGAWYGDIVGALLLVGLLRLVANHHLTFFINSLAHLWGSQPYSEDNSAKDNPVLAFLTYGEGYHNFHHVFQADYRNGVRWYQWDPTKWMIRCCAWLGLARNLNRVPSFKIQRALLAMQLTRASNQLETNTAAEHLRELLEREYLLFSESLTRWTALQAERYERTLGELEGVLAQQKAALRTKWQRAALRTRLRELEYSLKMQRKRVELLMLQMQSVTATAAA